MVLEGKGDFGELNMGEEGEFGRKSVVLESKGGLLGHKG